MTNTPIFLENQLLVTKFFLPSASGPLICRPRLTSLLDKSLKYPFTLISAPAGFGKTTLLSTWGQTVPTSTALLAWVSLEEEDNNPQQFWTYVLAALDRQHPKCFGQLLKQLQSSQISSPKSLLGTLINLLVESDRQFLLILDDYQVITEQQVHTTLSYLIEHLPPQLHIILATREDPLLPLPQMRARGQLLEIHTEQLRCTPEETRAFFQEVMDTELPQDIIQEVIARTEGWLVGLQLLGLSLLKHTDPSTLLQQIHGNQRHILDYLTEEVLRQQPQDIQTFLLSTCILQQLTAPLCDAVMQQHGSQQMLGRLDHANLFVVSLDSKREWFRYHPLFAQALRYQRRQTDNELTPTLHYRASLWYAQHDQTTQAILHAFQAQKWQWAADLIEHLPLMSLAWQASEQELGQLREWLEQLPAEVVHARPRLCLACTQMLWAVTPEPQMKSWFQAAETMLTTSLTLQTPSDASQMPLSLEERQQQQNLLGEIISFRAIMRIYKDRDGQSILSDCQRARTLLSADNYAIQAQVAHAQFKTYYYTINDAPIAIESGHQAVLLAQTAGRTAMAFTMAALTSIGMIGAGKLHEAQQLTQQVIMQETRQGDFVIPEVGYSSLVQASILDEWNQLDAAHTHITEALSLCKQTASIVTRPLLLCGYAILLHIALSRGELDVARSALQQFECIGMSMSKQKLNFYRSFFTAGDQIRLWIASGELDRATHWAEKRYTGEQTSPFILEREEVAHVRLLLAKGQFALALEQLEPVLQRATMGQRWGHVIEIQLLKALAHQKHREETQALAALSEAVRLGKPEGYVRSFVDEGAPMATLLSKLREEQGKAGPTPYLDTLLAAFAQENKMYKSQPRQVRKRTKTQPLLDPLSEREQEVLQLLVDGASNQEIAQELVIAIDTAKRHVSHIFSKLGVQNRVQAIKQTQVLGLLSQEP